jgi:hypothetical protein
MRPLDARTPGTMGIEGRALRRVNIAIVGGADIPCKAFATLCARAALAGHALDQRSDEQGAVLYTASRWGWSRTFTDLEAVDRWLRGVTGRDAS